jgi:hypothetical protein
MPSPPRATPVAVPPPREKRIPMTEAPEPPPDRRDIHPRPPAPELPEGEAVEDDTPSGPVRLPDRSP